MCNTISQIMSSVMLDVGGKNIPDSILNRSELANIIYRHLSFRMEGVRQSEQAELITRTANFTLGANENTYNLTEHYSDFVIPLWAEAKTWDYLSNDVFTFLPTVHLSMLQKKRDLGEYACSFYGGNPTEVIIETSLYGNEILSPGSTLRVFYSPDVPLPGTEDATLELPNNLVNMVRYDSTVSALALMKANAAVLVTVQPQLVPQMAEWNNLYAHFLMERREFQKYFDKWRLESRGSHRPRRRGDILRNTLNNGTNFPWFYRGGGN